ncbi:L-seryl-tRNA(Sec) kinase [Mixophyes fleayi]|uniref:L-seryl-tRNA(Sec) kinase n=1 Tax=Mixophyes fleayi TaxID=3061075 RepID=UPI003F4E02DE
MDEPSRTWNIGLCVLCGLPGAGKSTLARGLQNGDNPFPVVVITYDDVITDAAFQGEPVCESPDISCQSEEAGGRQTSLWKQYRQNLLQCLEHLIVALLSCSNLKAPDGIIEGHWNRFVQCLESQGLISAAKSVSDFNQFLINPKLSPICLILDDNFYYQSMRYEVYQLARKYSLGFCQLYLHCSTDCCLLRNTSRPHPVTDKTILLMDQKIEKPNPEKNTWEKNSLVLDSSRGIAVDDSRITDFLNRALASPVTPPEDDTEEKDKDREICAANIVHQADQSLRRLISETMQTVKGSVCAHNIKGIAQELQCAKAEALDQLRQSMSGKTILCLKTDIHFNAQSFFKEEKDHILRRYLHKDPVP